MVIIEVDREFDRFDNLLGMHSWSEFLLAPTEEEAGNSSKVFYCTYHNANAVRGAGGRAYHSRGSGPADTIHRFVVGNR